MYKWVASVREILDDQTKDGGTNIHEGEQAWKTYTQWMMVMMMMMMMMTMTTTTLMIYV
jgi:hypothetical protein